MTILRGQVWWADFTASTGGETQKKRPAIIISNDKANYYSNRVQIVPLTSNIEKCYPGEAIIDFNGKKNKAMANQIVTFDKGKLLSMAGEISDEDMRQVEIAILIQLGIK